MAAKCKIQKSKQGQDIPVLFIDGKECWMGSRYDGEYAASRWMEYHIPDGVENVIMLGMGDMQLIRMLLERIPGEVVVYEPETILHKEMQHTGVYKSLQKRNRLHLISEENPVPSLGQCVTELLNEDCVECTMLVTHPCYETGYAKEQELLQQICGVVCDKIGFLKAPLQRFIHGMIRNQMTNVPRMEHGIPLVRLRKKWNAEIPVILVSAGPSLEKNVEELKNVRERAYILAVDAAVPMLLQHNIIPDLAASTDATKHMGFMQDKRSEAIPFLVTSNTNPVLFEKNTAPKIWGYDHTYVQEMCRKINIPTPAIFVNLGVAMALYAAALEWGTKEIILIGQDLSFSEDGKSHVTGQQECFVKDENYKTEGYFGGEVWSRMDWMTFKNWFEEKIMEYPDVCVINATEGGVKIKGAVQKTLAQCVKELPDKTHALAEWLQDPSIALTQNEYEQLMTEWKKGQDDLEQIRQWGYERTFFQEDYTKIPVMGLILSYMKTLEESSRKRRFEMALEYLQQIGSGGNKGEE